MTGAKEGAMRNCPIKGCTETVAANTPEGEHFPNDLMCAAHWSRVPRGLQEELMNYCLGRMTAHYPHVSEACIAAVEKKGRGKAMHDCRFCEASLEHRIGLQRHIFQEHLQVYEMAIKLTGISIRQMGLVGGSELGVCEFVIKRFRYFCSELSKPLP